MKISVSYGYEKEGANNQIMASRECYGLTTGNTDRNNYLPFYSSTLQHIRGENGP